MNGSAEDRARDRSRQAARSDPDSARLSDAERAEIIQQLVQLMRDYGLTVKDLAEDNGQHAQRKRQYQNPVR
ncbi:hypothetical protein [Paraburkholderia caffeinilytica]|uniref:hypothetical protein n=1 Tax=Paraburkholderia caffeinilytica TaxID=1761016 RepID=UPI003DA00844